jgi:hypothetical protein
MERATLREKSRCLVVGLVIIFSKTTAMITKAEVIDMYRASKRDSEKLLARMQEQDADNPNHQENLQLLQLQISMVDLLIEALEQDDYTQEELQHHLNQALSFGIEEN